VLSPFVSDSVRCKGTSWLSLLTPRCKSSYDSVVLTVEWPIEDWATKEWGLGGEAKLAPTESAQRE
jgi:hypothetical protein